MAVLAISLNPSSNFSSVTQINCGYPAFGTLPLGGNIDISPFVNLQQFRCNDTVRPGHNITSVTGYEDKKALTYFSVRYNLATNVIPTSFSSLSGLTTYNVQRNRLTNSTFPSVSALTKIQTFDTSHNYIRAILPDISFSTTIRTYSVSYNLYTGSLPVISACSSLQTFEINYNNGIDQESISNTNYFPNGPAGTIVNNGINGTIPLFGPANSSLKSYVVHSCNLNGSIPPLTALVNITNFECHNQGRSNPNFAGIGFTGNIPYLNGCVNLQTFNCNSNFFTGAVPSLSSLSALTFFDCSDNNLTDFTLSPLASSGLKYFSANANNFTLTATWYCLSAFYTSVRNLSSLGNSYNGTIILSGNTMPRLQTAAAGPINGAIYSYVRALTSKPTPNWFVSLPVGTTGIAYSG